MVLDRNRGGSYLAILVAGVGMFGIFLFLTYYLQDDAGTTRPVITGVAFLPMVGGAGRLRPRSSNSVLLPRFGPKAVVPVG